MSNDIRVKDEHANHDLNKWKLSPEMNNFMSELEQTFPSIRITSGRREGNQNSHHHTGNAVDIGKEHSDVYDYLMNTKEGLSLMNKYGLGIIDETDPVMMQKTGATGPHAHIGRDSKFVEQTKNRLEQFDHITPIHTFYSQNQNFDYKNVKDYKPEDYQYKPQLTNIESSTPFNLILGTPQVASQFINDVKHEQKKEEVKKEIESKSDARKLLAESKAKKEEQKKQFLNSMFEQMNKDTMAVQNRTTSQIDQQQQVPLPEIAQLQKGLPDLPTIFTLPEFKNGGNSSYSIDNFKPHYMYDQQGNKYFAATYEDHIKMTNMGYTH